MFGWSNVKKKKDGVLTVPPEKGIFIVREYDLDNEYPIYVTDVQNRYIGGVQFAISRNAEQTFDSLTILNIKNSVILEEGYRIYDAHDLPREFTDDITAFIEWGTRAPYSTWERYQRHKQGLSVWYVNVEFIGGKNSAFSFEDESAAREFEASIARGVAENDIIKHDDMNIVCHNITVFRVCEEKY